MIASSDVAAALQPRWRSLSAQERSRERRFGVLGAAGLFCVQKQGLGILGVGERRDRTSIGEGGSCLDDVVGGGLLRQRIAMCCGIA